MSYKSLISGEARARRKKIKVALFAAVSLALLAVLAVLGIAAKVGWSLTHPERHAVDQTPAAVGLTYEEVSLPKVCQQSESRRMFIRRLMRLFKFFPF
ncbi:MAG: hypothetical protein ACYC38_05435 [Eubacteriales bacterium]